MNAPSRVGLALARAGWVALAVSLPVSISGLEIAKALLLLGALSLWAGKGFPLPRPSVGSVLFGLLLACVAASFLLTNRWGDASEGSLRVLPVHLPFLLLVPAVAWLLRNEAPPLRIMTAGFLVALAVGTSFSLLRGGDRTTGFFGHAVVYGHLLSLSTVAVTFLLLFRWPIAGTGRWPSWVRLSLLSAVGALVLLDVARNASRSVLLALLVLALVLVLWRWPRRRTLLLVPLLVLLFAGLFLAIPHPLRERVRHHLYPVVVTNPLLEDLDVRTVDGTLLIRGVIAKGAERPIAFLDTVRLTASTGRPVVGDAAGGFAMVWPLPKETFRLRVDGRTREGGPSTDLVVIGPHQGRWVIVDRRSFHGLTPFRFFGFLREAPPRDWPKVRWSILESYRSWAWKLSWDVGWRGPVFGAGPGNWKWALANPERNPGVEWYRNEVAAFGEFFHAHSNLLTLLVEYGPIGAFLWLFCVLLLVGGAVIRILRERRLAIGSSPSGPGVLVEDPSFRVFALTVLLVSFVGGLFDYTVFGVAGAFFWIASGALWSDLTFGERPSGKRPPASS